MRNFVYFVVILTAVCCGIAICPGPGPRTRHPCNSGQLDPQALRPSDRRLRPRPSSSDRWPALRQS